MGDGYDELPPESPPLASAGFLFGQCGSVEEGPTATNCSILFFGTPAGSGSRMAADRRLISPDGGTNSPDSSSSTDHQKSEEFGSKF